MQLPMSSPFMLPVSRDCASWSFRLSSFQIECSSNNVREGVAGGASLVRKPSRQATNAEKCSARVFFGVDWG